MVDLVNPLGPHAVLVAQALVGVAAADEAAWHRAALITWDLEDVRWQNHASRLATIFGRLAVDCSPYTSSYGAARSRLGDRTDLVARVTQGLRITAVADLLNPAEFAHLTRWLRAVAGPIAWPAAHPLCRLCCSCKRPLGAHMASAAALWGRMECGAWPGMTEEQTDVAETLVRDGELAWEEIVAVVPRLA